MDQIDLAIFYHGSIKESGTGRLIRDLSQQWALQGRHHVLISQEDDLESIPFISEAWEWTLENEPRKIFERNTAYKGRVVAWKTELPQDKIPLLPGQSPDDVHYDGATVIPFSEWTEKNQQAYNDTYSQQLRFVLNWHGPRNLVCPQTIFLSDLCLEECQNTGCRIILIANAQELEQSDLIKDKLHTLLKFSHQLWVCNPLMKDQIIQLDSRIQDLQDKILVLAPGFENYQWLPPPHEVSPDVFWNTFKDTFPEGPVKEKLSTINYLQSAILTCISPLKSVSGLQDILFSWPEIADQFPSAHLIIFGKGDDQAWLQRLMLALATGTQSEVLAILGQQTLYHTEAAQYYLQEVDWKHYSQLCTQVDWKNQIHFITDMPEESLHLLWRSSSGALFPNVHPEIFPALTWEAISFGVLPLIHAGGTYLEVLERIQETMKWRDRNLCQLAPDPRERIFSIIEKVPLIIQKSEKYQNSLMKWSEEELSWKNFLEATQNSLV